MDRSRLTEPSLVSTTSSTRFLPFCSFSNRYIQLVWSSWNFSSSVTTRRARSLADNTGLTGTDWGRAGIPSRTRVRVRARELFISLTGNDDASRLHVLDQ